MTLEVNYPLELWTKTTISKVSQIVMGQAPPGSSYNERQIGVPLIGGAGDLGNEYPNPNKWTTLPTKLCQPGDIIYCIRATISEMNWADKEYCLGRGVAALRPLTKIIEPGFLFYWLKASRNYFISRGTGSTFLEIHRQDIEDAPIILPPLPEQHRIVEILHLVNNLRSQQYAILAEAQKLIPSIFHEMFGDISSHEKYTYKRLGHVAEVVSGVTKGRKLNKDQTVRVPYLRVANVQAGYIDLSEVKTIEVLPSDIKRYRLQYGDVLLTEGGDLDKLGRGAIWEYDIPDCIHQNHIFRVRLDQTQLLPSFFSYLLQTPYAKQYFLRSAKKTTNLASINMRQLQAFYVPIPSISLQQEFVKRIETIRSILDRIATRVQEHDKLFQSIMSSAFTGELTKQFRQSNLALLQQAAAERDHLLSQARTVRQSTTDDPLVANHHRRATLLSALSNSTQDRNYGQTDLYELIQGLELAYFTTQSIQQMNENFPVNFIARNLELFEKVGLILRISLPVAPTGRQSTYFETYYRLPRSTENGVEVNA